MGQDGAYNGVHFVAISNTLGTHDDIVYVRDGICQRLALLQTGKLTIPSTGMEVFSALVTFMWHWVTQLCLGRLSELYLEANTK